ncbi:MAG TPA: 2-amino-4-hydroxy-6-hydroxymethyldihydropteridine diphosphokinase [Clostridiaceae bacterium]|nr:2-amino-4-hydroxy-6-hydroxymethyldihydropteridine diphosphokinase [Clostridiaceae bacterium]
MERVYLSLGSNMGDREANLEEAVRLLKEKVRVRKVSALYETEPWGFKDQDRFLNIALEGETDLMPLDLLDFTQGIEMAMKRVKTRVYGPRIIDVDILLYGDVEMHEDRLTIPHPKMKERAFVLIPLQEIAEDLKIGNEALSELVSKVDEKEVTRLEAFHGPL